MNILFANHSDFASNSLNHIGAFANRLTRLGHACVVAVPDNPASLTAVPEPLFTAATFARALEAEPIFPNRQPADVLHVWTPREILREFTLAYLHRHPRTVLIIHLEDNEIFLMESFAHAPYAELRQLSDEEVLARLSPRLSHPVRFTNFLRLAHGVTFITDRLIELVPIGKPTHRLLPGIDAALYQPVIPDPVLRTSIGLKPEEKVLVYTGSTTFATLADIRILLLAVRLLNERGTPCKLVRTGINPPALARELAALGGGHVIDLGFVDKNKLSGLLALADVLVQPGAVDDFNDYRLPSKVPEFLSVGRPVITPRANLARTMEDGRHALLLQTGTAEEIVEQCLRVFADPALAARLSAGALEFARAHFDLPANTAALLDFYGRVQAVATPFAVDPRAPVSEDVLLATGDTALRFRAKEQTIARAAKVSYEHAKLEAERTKVEVLRLQLASATDTAVILARELESLKEQRAAAMAAELRQADKVARMAATFSWRATAPLRTLRRLIIDPLKAKKASAPRPLPTPDDRFLSLIEEPADWSATPAAGTWRGWIVARDGSKIAGVRARVNDRVLPGTYLLPRPDVAASQPGLPEAAHSGFVIEYQFPPDTLQPVILEALTADGRWRCFTAVQARIFSAAEEEARRDYPAWVHRFDTLSLPQVVTYRARFEGLPPAQRPLISILMPTYNTPERWLVKAIESVRRQFYPHWELCIADDASTAPHVRRILEDFANRDARIKLTFRAENGHISAASNSALALATGEFTALLDHDDELAPHALAEVALALIAETRLEFIYTDEDKIDEQGHRFEPYFKPDWNPDLLLGQNYTCHLSVFRTVRLRAIGGFRVGYEGSQDWDITLRATENLDPALIRHLPRILYHWRAIAGSTALSVEGKDNYPFVAAKKALADHLSRRGITAELIAVAGRHWRVQRPLPSPAPKVSIIIPTRNAEHLLRPCIDSIFSKTDYPDFEVIVVNNRSNDPGTLAYFSELRAAGVRILDYDAPFNFSALNNFAAREARGSLLAFLNNDLEVISPGWLAEMASQAVRPEIGAVGAMLYYPNDTVQHAGVILGLTGPAKRDGVAGHAFKCAPRGSEGQRNRLRLVQNYSAVTAACLVIRREVFNTVGGFNETDLAVAFNDIDFCLRVRAAGYRNLWTPFAELYHHESVSRGAEDTPEKIARFQREVAYMRRQWGALLDRDPAYNPNLTIQIEDFSLAFPPRT